MTSASDYLNRVYKVIGHDPGKKGKIDFSIHWDSIAEAKILLIEVRNKQKQLRLIKKDIGFEIKKISYQYEDEASSVSPGFGASLFLGKGTAKSLAASKKRQIRDQKRNNVQPYEAVKRLIDEIILKYDIAKFEITQWIDDYKEIPSDI